ncbi:MAG: hypothetical protein AAFR61_22935 [Bacteroidota bacterium]
MVLAIWLFSLHLLVSLMMTGVIWFVQIVHYPLFRRVGDEHFTAYEAAHTQRTGWLVAPLMLAELGSGIALHWTEMWEGWNAFIWANSLLLAGIWLCTFFIQVPLHGALLEARNARAIDRLVWTNWIRSFLWSARAGILVYIASQQMISIA